VEKKITPDLLGWGRIPTEADNALPEVLEAWKKLGAECETRDGRWESISRKTV